jgi:hypothetical protein
VKASPLVHIEPDTAETSALGIPVGRLEPIDPARLPSGDVIASAARQAGYALVTLATPIPAAVSRFRHMGTLLTYAGNVEALRSGLPAARRFQTVFLEDSNWELVTRMLGHAAPTRFSRDPHIQPERVRERKLNILRGLHARGRGVGAFALADPDDCVGFLYSYVHGGTLTFYELMTAQRSGRALVALDLIAATLGTFSASGFAFERVSAAIYADNDRSRAFFTRLGLEQTGDETFHYHLWV